MEGHFQVGQLPFCASLTVIFSRPTRYFLEVDVLSEEGIRHNVPDGRNLDSKLLTSVSLNPSWQQPYQSSATTTNTEIAQGKSATSKWSTYEKTVKPIPTAKCEGNYRQKERQADIFPSTIFWGTTACRNASWFRRFGGSCCLPQRGDWIMLSFIVCHCIILLNLILSPWQWRQ